MRPQRPPRVIGLHLRVMESGFLEPYTLRENLLRMRAAGADVALWTSTEHAVAAAWPDRVAAALARAQPDLVLVDHVWRRDVLDAGRQAAPAAQWVRTASSVPMPHDAWLDRVVSGDDLLAWTREGAWPATPIVRPTTAAALRQRRRDDAAPAADLPELDLDGEPVVAGRPSIRGPMDGCPFLLDAAANPVFAGLNLDGVQRKGCVYCLDNTGVYQLPPTDEIVAAWLEQLQALTASRGQLGEVLIADERPHPHLPALMRALVDRPHLHGIRFLWKSRVDWLVQFGHGPVAEACELASASQTVLDLYLIGFENFADSALQRMNKGVTAADNLAAIAVVEQLGERFAQTFRWQDSKGHGIILFSPWTTPDELRTNARVMREVAFERLRSGALRTRLRLYPNLPLHRLAERDGLLAPEFETGRDRAAEQGYSGSLPWRFADRATAVAWQLCDQVGALLVPDQPEHACLAEAVRWAEWLAPAHDLQPVLAWRAWERAGRPAAAEDNPIPDADLAGLGQGSVLLRSLPGEAEALAAVYERLGFVTRATAHTVTVARTASALTAAAALPRAPVALDLHVWSLLAPAPPHDARWQLEADGLVAQFPAADGPWSGLRLTCGSAGLVVRPLWPNPATVPTAAARRVQVEALLAWLTKTLTPDSLVPPACMDHWSEAERWPLPRPTLSPWTAAPAPLERRDAVWACPIALRDPSGAVFALEVQLLASPPQSPAAARTDLRWLVHGELPSPPPGGWAPLLRQLAAWWTACERGASASLR